MTLAELKHVELATVWKAKEPAARLTRDRSGVAFEYDKRYSGPPVAFTLPRDVGVVHHRGGALPPFFSGLLPEGRRLTAIRRATKTSLDDELTLLLAVGADTVGDVQVLPGDRDANADPVPSPRRPALEEADFAELFEQAVAVDPADRVALSGVQDKVSGRMISLPISHAGSAWILKLDPPEFPHLVANEAFFLDAARASGLDVADAKVVHDRNGTPALLVRRFDRISDDTVLRALPQEDACQVLGRYPADKYRCATEEVIQGLANCTGAPIIAARTLLRQFAFAYLTCNGDAHAKNFSILQRKEWQVAPAYDLTCSHLYGDHVMALTICGKDRENIGRGDFVELGAQCGVPPRATTRVLDELLAASPAWLDRLGELPFDERRLHKLRRTCLLRASRLGA